MDIRQSNSGDQKEMRRQPEPQRRQGRVSRWFEETPNFDIVLLGLVGAVVGCFVIIGLVFWLLHQFSW